MAADGRRQRILSQIGSPKGDDLEDWRRFGVDDIGSWFAWFRSSGSSWSGRERNSASCLHSVPEASGAGLFLRPEDIAVQFFYATSATHVGFWRSTCGTQRFPERSVKANTPMPPANSMSHSLNWSSARRNLGFSTCGPMQPCGCGQEGEVSWILVYRASWLHEAS